MRYKPWKFVVYAADDGWRWHLMASNGRIVADSGEAYTRRYEAVLAVQRMWSRVPASTLSYVADGS